MKNQNKIEKDEIYNKRKAESLITVSFLSALKKNLKPDLAFTIASDAFTRYMVSIYEEVLGETEIGSQKRFDCFREFYEEHSKKTPYLEILESTPSVLRVKYNRCPFFEILSDYNLEELAYSFCLSDPAFTKEVLPGVKFSRSCEIAKGFQYCDNTWEYGKNDVERGK